LEQLNKSHSQAALVNSIKEGIKIQTQNRLQRTKKQAGGVAPVGGGSTGAEGGVSVGAAVGGGLPGAEVVGAGIPSVTEPQHNVLSVSQDNIQQPPTPETSHQSNQVFIYLYVYTLNKINFFDGT
jgi:E3 ubiquitin-protein ligase RNF1/2